MLMPQLSHIVRLCLGLLLIPLSASISWIPFRSLMPVFYGSEAREGDAPNEHLISADVSDGMSQTDVQRFISEPPEPLIIYKGPTNSKLFLRTSFADDISTQIHHKQDTGMDPCRILVQCFAENKVFGDPVECKRCIDRTIRSYDSAFMVEVQEGQEDKIVGFMSVGHEVSYKSRSINYRKEKNLPPQQDDYHALILYNVCIDEEKRGQGIARKMIPQFIDELIKHYKLERYANSNGRYIDRKTGYPVPPLLIGLDVDLTSDTMSEAFSLYAQLGFLRWWTPCTSVSDHDWTSLVHAQLNYAKSDQGYSAQELRDVSGNIKRSTGLLPTRQGEFPVAQMLWDPNTYLKNAFNLESPADRPTNFCMYKFYHDSFGSLAKRLQDYAENQK